MIPDESFPRLTNANHRVTSDASTDYNCVAWSAGDTTHWWQPGVHWPVTVPPNDYSVAALAKAFESLGYEPCVDGGLEPGVEKVALYGVSIFYSHVARQLSTGKWTSKLGAAEDIEHDTPEVLAGGAYGRVVQFMKRLIRIA
jgi:hypothetical protein